ncbi:metal ABC transporter solute-binding protein, Zn/Mn family [Mechercharimyces sp. CAU 1602]|uniref:metal ABC transporter solute-binding protein, Zn/Mn family n=1 Tax=Mechercharimyces sp. CAU 1602 TaxID=2973933 RepID=UPI0021611223|nr:zinc ABC transporter substrate-binding protein [Mechercharimyces sp. CAU 1602]MCS1352721.1 zinc ABC transporter substrate-binding protein [Mechercharimyces sp. CAU 1602]
MKSKMKYCIAILIVMSTITLLVWMVCPEEKEMEQERLLVFTSFYPLADFADKIGGEHVEVTMIVPAGVDPHEYEPSAKDLAHLSKADVFLYNGAGFESWAQRATSMLEKEESVVVATIHEALAEESEMNEEAHHDEHDEHEEEEHDHGGVDPHVWLDPLRAQAQAKVIRDALIEADPDHRTEYEDNYAQLYERLQGLHDQIDRIAQQSTHKHFVTSHAAFGYLAERYGLQQLAVHGLVPADEPSAKELEEVITSIRELGVEVLLIESLTASRAMSVIERETGVRTLSFHSLEGLTKTEVQMGEDYFSIMETNIAHLREALEGP